MNSIHSRGAAAVAFLTTTRISHRLIAQHLLMPDTEVRRIAHRLLHLGLTRDELARLSEADLNRLIRRRRRHRHVYRASGGAA